MTRVCRDAGCRGTDGAVAFQLSPGTSALGQAQNQLDQVRNGVAARMAVLFRLLTKERLP